MACCWCRLDFFLSYLFDCNDDVRQLFSACNLLPVGGFLHESRFKLNFPIPPTTPIFYPTSMVPASGLGGENYKKNWKFIIIYCAMFFRYFSAYYIPSSLTLYSYYINYAALGWATNGGQALINITRRNPVTADLAARNGPLLQHTRRIRNRRLYLTNIRKS